MELAHLGIGLDSADETGGLIHVDAVGRENCDLGHALGARSDER
jgi:hypothetical protein